MVNIKDYIVDVVDFPKKGIIFKDLTPLLANSDAFFSTIEAWAIALKNVKADKILAMEARGFLFATPLSIALNIPVIPVRKKGKLPRETVSETYQLEYNTDTICVHKDDIKEGDFVLIVDDLLATGGTAKAACNLAKKCGAKIAACTFLCELDFLNGRELLKDVKVLTMQHL